MLGAHFVSIWCLETLALVQELFKVAGAEDAHLTLKETVQTKCTLTNEIAVPSRVHRHPALMNAGSYYYRNITSGTSVVYTKEDCVAA